MDTLKSLMDKHEFELVIKLTEKSEDLESVFYRVSAFVGIGQTEKALDTLKAHRNILKQNLYLLIKVHIDLLLILGKFDEAYDELEYYKNLPYESQQVEELLAELPKHIREEEKAAYGNVKASLSDDDLKARLKSDDKGTVLSALDIVGSRDVQKFYSELQYVMAKNPYQSIRSFALMLLVQKRISNEFYFLGKTGIIKVVPSSIKPPFVGDPFNSVSRRMISEFKNPSISDNAIDILSAYIIDIYPTELNAEEDYIVGALYLLSCDCLQIKDAPSMDEYCQTHNLDQAKCEELYKKFAEIVQNF